MGNCLVVKLNSNVENDELMRINEMKVTITKACSIMMKAEGELSLHIVTPGVTFTNSDQSGNKQIIPVGVNRIISVSGACDLLIYGKYKLINLAEQTQGYLKLNLEDLRYSPDIEMLAFYNAGSYGDISALKNASKMKSLLFTKSSVTGDLSDLFSSDACYSIRMSYNLITGDISNFINVPNIKDITMNNTRISGNVSVFATTGKFNAIRDINMVNTNVSGNISSFANHSTLRDIQLFGSSVIGRLGDLLVGTPSLKGAYLPIGVEWTEEDAARADSIMQANGGTITSIGHYFGGGTKVDSYTN